MQQFLTTDTLPTVRTKLNDNFALTAPAGSAGQIQFKVGSVLGADSLLSWDNTNKRLGVGETTPTARVHIKGVGTTSGTESFRIDNSDGANIITVRDDKRVIIGGSGDGEKLNIGNPTGYQYSFRVAGDQLWLEASGGSSINRFNVRGNLNVTGSLINSGILSVNNIYHFRGAESTTGGSGRHTVVQLGNALGNIEMTGLSAATHHVIIRGGLTNNFKNLGLHIENTQTANCLEIFTGSTTERTILSAFDKNGNLAIGKENLVDSAMLELQSTTKGFLPPRMTGAQVEAIASPAEGLLAYATNAGAGAVTSKGWWGYDGTTWVKLN